MATLHNLVDELHAGSITVDDLEAALKTKRMPKVKRVGSTGIDETADPAEYSDDSFFWVGVALDRGDITTDDYDRLVKAAVATR